MTSHYFFLIFTFIIRTNPSLYKIALFYTYIRFFTNFCHYYIFQCNIVAELRKFGQNPSHSLKLMIEKVVISTLADPPGPPSLNLKNILKTLACMRV